MRSSRRATAGIVAMVVVLVVGTCAWIAVRQGSSSCDDAAALPDGLDATDVRLSPFAAGSEWRLSLDQVDGVHVDETATAQIRVGTPAGPADEEGSVGTWINAEEFSIPIVQAESCDPIASIEEGSPDEDLSGTEIRIPASARPAAGTDAHLIVVQPDGHTAVELWAAERLDAERWRAGRVEIVDLAGSGLGPDNGVRAYGGSALGGLIRTWEVDPADPAYTDGVIRHPLAVALPAPFLFYGGGEPGYDTEGYSMMQGYVAPATEMDYNAPSAYGGTIPMGARLVLPADVDVDALDISPAARTIARALQDYGAFVVDRSDAAVIFYAEPTAPADWVAAVRQGDGSDLDTIRERLVAVVPD
jgi:hypothetical protein